MIISIKEFLRKIKLIESLSTEIRIQKNEFIAILKKHVEEGDTGVFSDFLDVCSSSKKEYKGEVRFDGFKIKRRRKFFEMNSNLAVASGNYTQNNEKLIIETEINGFSGMMIPFYIFSIIFYSIFIIGILLTNTTDGDTLLFVVAFIFIHAIFMLGIPYFIMIHSIKRMKYELEREFFYITKK